MTTKDTEADSKFVKVALGGAILLIFVHWIIGITPWYLATVLCAGAAISIVVINRGYFDD